MSSAPALHTAGPEEAQRLLEAMHVVERLLGAVDNLEALLQTIIDESRRLAEAEASSLLLFDAVTNELYFHVALSDAGNPEALKQSVRLKPGEGIAGRVATERTSINVPDAAADARVHRAADAITRFTTRSLLAVPMIDAGRLVGVVEALNKRGGQSFTALDQRILEMFSALAAVAITRARLIETNLRSERLAAVGQAVAGISHHTKNILTALDASVELVDRGLADKKENLVQEGWPILRRSVGRLSHVVEDMLAFSKPRKPMCEAVDVGALIRETVQSFHALIAKRDITITTDTAGLRGPAWADPHALHQALLNLLTNAADAVPLVKGYIAIEARHAKTAEAEIVVGDNGPGVPESDRVRVFDPFYSTKGSKGTGLGLAVTQKIMLEHNGSVGIDTAPLGGARFTLRLPPRTQET